MNTLLWWLAQNTLTLCVLIPLVALACRLFRHRPAVQHLFWLVVLVKFLTPPVVAWPWSLDAVRVSLWPTPVAADSAPVASVADAKTAGLFEMPRLPPEIAELDAARTQGNPQFQLTDSLLAELTMLEADGDHAETGAVAQSAPSTALGVNPDVVRSSLTLAAGVWFVGAVVCLARHARRIVRHARLLRAAVPASSQLNGEIEAIAHSLGLRPPRALLSPRIRSPFVWCFGPLRLVWPLALSGGVDVARSRGVIAHELAHIRRGDHLVAWFELVALVVWWWNPLFWFARRRLRESAEMACDALAIGAFPEDRAEYAELLLQLSSEFESSLPAPVLAVGALSPSSFERRLTMILSERVSGKVSARGVLLTIFLALVAVPGWALGQAEPETPEKSQSNDPNLKSAATTDPAAEAPLRATNQDGNLNPATTQAVATPPAVAAEPKAETPAPLNPASQDPLTTKPGFTLERIQKLEAENRRLVELLHVLQNQAQAQQKGNKSADPLVRPAEEKLDTRQSKVKAWLNQANKVEYNRRGEATVKLTPDEAYTRASADLQSVRQRLEELREQAGASPELLDQAKRDLVVAEEQLREIVQILLKQQRGDAKFADQQRLAAELDYQELLKRFPKGPENGDRESWAALLKMVQARAVEQAALQRQQAEAAAAQAKVAQQHAQHQALAVAKQTADAITESQTRLAVRKSFASAAADNPLDVAERYLRAEADLKTARGRLARLKKSEAGGGVSQQEIEELEIELERAEKLCRLLTAYIHEARKSAAAARQAVQGEYSRVEQLYKAATISRSELDAVKARLDEADARVRQFEAIGAIVPQEK